MQTATSFSLASHAAQVHLSCKMFHVKHSYASNDNAAPRSHKRATDAAPPSPAPSPCPRSPLAPSPSTLAVRAPAPIRRHDPAQGLSHPHSSAISMPTSPSIRAPPVHPSSQPAYPHPTSHHAQPSVPHRSHAQLSVPHRPSQPEHPRAREPSRPEYSHAVPLETPRIGQKFSISNYLLVFLFHVKHSKKTAGSSPAVPWKSSPRSHPWGATSEKPPLRNRPLSEARG